MVLSNITDFTSFGWILFYVVALVFIVLPLCLSFAARRIGRKVMAGQTKNLTGKAKRVRAISGVYPRIGISSWDLVWDAMSLSLAVLCYRQDDLTGFEMNLNAVKDRERQPYCYMLSALYLRLKNDAEQAEQCRRSFEASPLAKSEMVRLLNLVFAGESLPEEELAKIQEPTLKSLLRKNSAKN